MSVGTVWTVGGLAPASTGVATGRGGLLASGTNAPLYTTSFLEACPNESEELETHEDRLAEALELDRTTRILEFRNPSTPSLRQVAPRALKGAEMEEKTTWKGAEWVLGGSAHSKLTKLFYFLELCDPDAV